MNRPIDWTRFAVAGAVATGAAIPVSVAATGALTALAVLLGLLAGEYRRNWRALLRHPVARAALALLAWLVLAIGWSEAPLDEAVRMLKKYRELLLLVLLLPLFADPRARRWGMAAFIAAMYLTLAVSYGKGLGLIALSPEDWGEPVAFKQRITQGVLMAFTAFWTARQILRDRQRRSLWGVLLALTTYNVWFMVGGRTGHLVYLALALLFLYQVRGWKGLAAGALGGLLLVGAAAVGSDLFRARLQEVEDGAAKYSGGTYDTSTALRLSFYRNSLALIAERPLLGYGTGAFASAYEAQVAGTGHPPTEHPHNEFMLLAVQTGLPGGLLFLLLLSIQWRRSAGLGDQERAMAQALVVTMGLGCLLNSFLYDSTEGHFYAYLTAVLFAAPPDRSPGEAQD